MKRFCKYLAKGPIVRERGGRRNAGGSVRRGLWTSVLCALAEAVCAGGGGRLQLSKCKQGTEIKCSFQPWSKGSRNYSLETHAAGTLKDFLRFVTSLYLLSLLVFRLFPSCSY